MKFFKKKNFLKKIIYSNLLLLFCLILIIFFSANLIRDFLNKRELTQEVEKLKKEMSNLTEKNDNLANLLDYLKTDDYLEEEARTKLNKKRLGEEIIIIPSNQFSTSSLANQEDVLAKTKNKKNIFDNLNKWWSYFFTTDKT